jgi:hypothetical protein
LADSHSLLLATVQSRDAMMPDNLFILFIYL